MNRYHSYLATLLGLLFSAAPALGQQTIADIHDDLWVPDGRVRATALVGDTLYIGGDFSYVGPPTGQGAFLSEATGEVVPGTARIGGPVLAIVSDGAGGWFVAGTFTYVDGEPRSGLARLLPDGSFDSSFDVEIASPTDFDPARIAALQLVGDTLYVGGDFTAVGGQPRTDLAAVDAATGGVLDFSVTVSDGFGGSLPDVRDFVVADGVVYLGGVFATVNGEPRMGAAAVDAATGALLPWDAALDYSVERLALGDSTLYLVGLFTTVGGEERSRLAEVTLAGKGGDGGTPTAWNPGQFGVDPIFPLDLVAAEDGLYLAGKIGHFEGQTYTEPAVVRVDRASGVPDALLDEGDGIALAIALEDDVIHVGLRGSYVKVDRATGAPQGTRVRAPGDVHAIDVTGGATGDALFVGGDFVSIGGATRPGFAALDLTTGLPTSLNVSFPSHDLAVTPDGRSLFGATFSEVRELDLRAGTVTAWRPAGLPSGDLSLGYFAVAATDSLVYVGGDFTYIGEALRESVAAFRRDTGALASWSPTVFTYTLYPVETMVAAEPYLYVAGGVSQVGSEERGGFAALDLRTGALAPWDPDIALFTGPIGRGLAVAGDRVYLGGSEIDLVSGEERENLAAVDRVTGDVLGWAPGVVGQPGVATEFPANAVAVASGAVYVGGSFTDIVGYDGFQQFAAAFDAETGERLEWDLTLQDAFGDALSSVNTLAIHPRTGLVYVGGRFSNSVRGSGHGFLVGVAPPTGYEVGTDPSAPTRPETATLSAPYPNPFSSRARLTLTVPQRADVLVEAFDLLGRRVAVLHEGPLEPGAHRVVFDGRGLPSGTYVVRATGGSTHLTQRITLIR